MLNLWVHKLTGRGDGGFVGAQASGDARARRQAFGFFLLASFFDLMGRGTVLNLPFPILDLNYRDSVVHA